MGFATFVLVSGFLSDLLEGGVLTATEKTSVLKLQVLWKLDFSLIYMALSDLVSAMSVEMFV
jgi:hypothetical protein